MSSTFSASEAIDLLIRLGWSFNGVSVLVGGCPSRVQWRVASSHVLGPAPQLHLEGWVVFGNGEMLGEVRAMGEDYSRHSECGTEVDGRWAWRNNELSVWLENNLVSCTASSLPPSPSLSLHLSS